MGNATGRDQLVNPVTNSSNEGLDATTTDPNDAELLTQSTTRVLEECTLGSGSEGSGMATQMPPLIPRPQLTFHSVHGENVKLFKSGRIAKRVESFCKGLAFSARPIEIDEIVCIKFAEMATNWSGVLRFGLTNTDPSVLVNNLPKFACPDLTSKEGSWAKALAERYCQQGSILHFYVRADGQLYYGINGVMKGLFLSNIHTQLPLYVMVDIYGNSTAVQFIDPNEVQFKPVKQSKKKSLAPVPPTNNDDIDIGTSPSSSALQSADDDWNTVHNTNAANAALSEQQQQQRQTVAATPSPTTTPYTTSTASLRYHSGVNFDPLPLHQICGKHVRLSADRKAAQRIDTEFDHGYVFTSRPVRLNEKIVLQIRNVLPAYSGGLAFGMTTCDPLHLRPESLPDDSDALLERKEYWVGIKDIAAKPKENDELAFYVDSEGRVHFYKNGSEPRVVMHVDETQNMWMYFDVYGSTHKIRIWGSTSVGARNRSPPPPPHQRTFAPPIPPPSIPPPPIPTTTGSGSTAGLRVNLPPPPPTQRTASTTNPKSRTTTITQQRVTVVQRRSYRIALNTRPLSVGNGRSRPSVSPNRQMSGSMSAATLRGAAPPTLPPKPIGRPPATLPRGASLPSTSYATNTATTTQRQQSTPAQADECTVCMSEAVNCVLYDCGHMCMCYECGKQQWDRRGECPVCRRAIRDVIKCYKS